MNVVRDSMRGEFNQRTVDEVVAGQREQLMESLRKNVDRDARGIGVEVIDVRLKRVDYSEAAESSVFDRRRSERTRVANERRSKGAAEKERIQAEAEDYFKRIDDLGGMIPAIEKGFPQREISAAAYRYQQEIDRRERLIVGVNEYIDEDEKIEIPILKITKEMVDRQVGNLKASSRAATPRSL